MSKELTTQKQSFSLAPQSMEEAFRFAEMLSKSNLVPKDFANNAGNILVAVQWGAELGLQPMQAMQNIAVINGRPSLWGDSVIALAKASPLCEYVSETVDDNGATCKVKRKGEPEQVRYFTVEDAKKAGLWGKQGPWTNYPKRMLQMRARSWALRDVFPDVLRGMPVAEELMDMTEKDVTPAPSGKEPTNNKVELPIDQSVFDINEQAWKARYLRGAANGLTVSAFNEWIKDKQGRSLSPEQLKIVSEWKTDVIEGSATVVNEQDVSSFVSEMNAAEASS